MASTRSFPSGSGVCYGIVVALTIAACLDYCSAQRANSAGQQSSLMTVIRKAVLDNAQQQQQQAGPAQTWQLLSQHHQQHQQQQIRHRRSATWTNCTPPASDEDISQQIESMSGAVFLSKTPRPNRAIVAPDGSYTHRPNSQPPTIPTTLDESGGQLCPHHYDVLELPEGYYPPTLKIARCTCTKCVENEGYRCLPVREAVTVLRPAGCFLGLQLYEEQVLPGLAKYCKCVR